MASSADRPVSRRAFRRFWLLVALGYAILAIGVVIAIAIVHNQADTIRDQNERLERQTQILGLAAGAYCAAGLKRDPLEDPLIHRLAVGKPIRIPMDCRRIIDRIDAAGR